MLDNNPYRPSAVAGDARYREHPDSGITWLVSGLSLAIVSSFVMTFLMIKVVPEIRSERFENNVAPSIALKYAIAVFDSLVYTWYAWPLLIAAAVMGIEFFLSPGNRRRARKQFGILIGVIPFAMLVLLIGATWEWFF